MVSVQGQAGGRSLSRRTSAVGSHLVISEGLQVQASSMGGIFYEGKNGYFELFPDHGSGSYRKMREGTHTGKPQNCHEFVFLGPSEQHQLGCLH